MSFLLSSFQMSLKIAFWYMPLSRSHHILACIFQKIVHTARQCHWITSYKKVSWKVIHVIVVLCRLDVSEV